MCLSEESKKRYKEFLEQLAKSKSKELFSNGGKDHAIVLYQVLLNYASGEVRIFCEEGVSEIWQDEAVRTALTDFISKSDSRLNILVENESDFGFADIRDRDNVEVRHISQRGLQAIHDHFDNNNCNFSVFGTDMFRFEYDKQGYKAYGSFNEPEISRSMITLFDYAWSSDLPR